MTQLTAVAFDVGDTLVEYEGVPLNWEAHYPDALRALAAQLDASCSPEQIDAACTVLRRYNTRLRPRTEEVPFSQILTELCPCLGVSTATHELACAAAFFRPFRQHLRCFPDTRPTLAALRSRGLRLGAFTDVPYGMPRELVLEDLRSTGLLDAIDVLLTSLDVGVRKPAPETLQRLATTLNCAPAEMMHVGNEKKDIEVAHAFGCRSVLLDRNRRGVEWGQDATITSLSEL